MISADGSPCLGHGNGATRASGLHDLVSHIEQTSAVESPTVSFAAALFFGAITVEFFNVVLGLKLNTQEKTGPFASMRAL